MKESMKRLVKNDDMTVEELLNRINKRNKELQQNLVSLFDIEASLVIERNIKHACNVIDFCKVKKVRDDRGKKYDI